MITMRVAGTLGGDLDRSRAICTPSVPRAQDGAAVMSAMLGISGFRAQADVQEWWPARSDECCALSRKGPNTRRPSTASALGRAERFALAEEAAILVSEVSCALPGCPPRETVVAFWTENERRHQFKLFKPVAEVVMDDLPPRWLKDALAAIEGLGCECC